MQQGVRPIVRRGLAAYNRLIRHLPIDQEEQMARVTATELDYRQSGWIEVSLLWDRDTDELIVSVRDAESGDSFEITVENNAHALEIFHHPYAYAPRPLARVPQLMEAAE